MSSTLIYSVKQGCEPVFIGQARNAWRGAMYVWNDISQRYFDLESFPFSDEEMRRKVWNAHNHKNITEVEHIVLTSTMDHAIVLRADIDELINAFEQYGKDHENSSYTEQAALIKASADNLPDGSAIAWIRTSVSGDVWFAELDEEREIYICDLAKAWDVIEQVNSCRGGKQ